jgi:spore coat polysaccharide biosynthesis protein SpsF
VTVHARSAFLQGILAVHDPLVWPKIKGVDAAALVRMIATLTEVFDRESPADLCLAYARGQSWIDGVVVGLESEEQLDDNLRLFVKSPLTPEQCRSVAARIPKLPVALLDPSLWPKG